MLGEWVERVRYWSFNNFNSPYWVNSLRHALDKVVYPFAKRNCQSSKKAYQDRLGNRPTEIDRLRKGSIVCLLVSLEIQFCGGQCWGSCRKASRCYRLLFFILKNSWSRYGRLLRRVIQYNFIWCIFCCGCTILQNRIS